MLNGKTKKLALVSVIVVLIVAVASLATAQSNSPCVTGGAVPAGSAALAQDCDTLLAMKTALRGTGNLNWWTGRPLQQWDGIGLGSGRVVEVSLANQGLDGTIPAGFGNLSALTTLNLSSNSLTGTIPSEIGNLSSLQSLSLDSNRLTGQIPEELNNLTNLTRWRLAGNNFTGCAPANLSLVADSDLDTLGLPVCGGSTPPPPPPPPMPDDEFDLSLYLFEALCEAEDLSEAFGENYTLLEYPIGLEWEHNGRGWWASVNSTWINDDNPYNEVYCIAIVYDNVSSAALDGNYHSVRLYNEGSYAITNEQKVLEVPSIGDAFLMLSLEHGAFRRTNEGAVTSVSRQSHTVSSLYGRGDRAVIVASVNYRNTDLNPIFQNTIIPPSVDSVIEVSRRIDARLSEASETNGVSRDSGNVNARGLQKADASTDARGFVGIGR